MKPSAVSCFIRADARMIGVGKTHLGQLSEGTKIVKEICRAEQNICLLKPAMVTCGDEAEER
jgi:hypothetical protein